MRGRAGVRRAVAGLAFGATRYYRLEGVSKAAYGAGGGDLAGLTAGSTDELFGVRLVSCEAADPGAVPLTGFQNADSFAPTWAAFLWEEWSRRGGG